LVPSGWIQPIIGLWRDADRVSITPKAYDILCHLAALEQQSRPFLDCTGNANAGWLKHELGPRVPQYVGDFTSPAILKSSRKNPNLDSALNLPA
jgi:hypothetical protein